MKKIISVLLCIAMLFSFCAFAAADDVPQLLVQADGPFPSQNSDSAMQYVCFDMKVINCTQFDSFQMIVRYNPDVLKLSNNYPFLLDEVLRKQTICTVQEPGVLLVTGKNVTYGNNEFDPFCFKIIGSGDTDISVELVSFKTADGEVDDIVFDASIENFTATVEAPLLTMETTKMNTDADSYPVDQYVIFRFSFKNCPDFESFQVKITYNPEVLELHPGYPFDLEQVERHNIEFTEEADGTVIVDGLKNEYGFMGEFNPFCLKVIGAGDTDISVELLSFKTADGEVEDVLFDSNIQNFAAKHGKPIVCIEAQDVVSKENAESLYRWECLLVSIANVENFERCEINVTLNTPPYSRAPVITENFESSNCANSLQKQEDGSYTIIVGAPTRNEDVSYAVYAFISEENVPLEFTVNSVKLYTADGEIDKNDFVLDERRLNGAGDFVRYDLDGNDKITAEDARQALRFAVGLDTATDAQCRTVGVRDANSFTSDIARFLLRAAVGLEGDVEKVVVNMEWVTDGETAYLLYHYSDGTYGTVGPMDGHRSSPDWF